MTQLKADLELSASRHPVGELVLMFKCSFSNLSDPALPNTFINSQYERDLFSFFGSPQESSQRCRIFKGRVGLLSQIGKERMAAVTLLRTRAARDHNDDRGRRKINDLRHDECGSPSFVKLYWTISAWKISEMKSKDLSKDLRYISRHLSTPST